MTASLFGVSRHLFAPLLALALATACGGGDANGTTPAPPSPPVNPMDAYPPTPAGPLPGASPAAKAAALALSKGVNFGGMLEAPNEGDWGLKADDEFINLMANSNAPANIKAVRLPVRWSNHASSDAGARIDPVFMSRVESIVNRLMARGVSVVLNMHHYRQLDGDPLDLGETAVADDVVKLRFLAMWKQIAERFASAGPGLVFELYNEPHGKQDAAAWNDLASRGLRVVRASNPTRVVMLGPVLWNSATALPQLQLPADAHLLLTFHHYEPFDFTHQGAEWVSPPLATGIDCCTAAQLAKLREPMDLAVREATRMGYPIVAGEFGAYSKASQPARVRYLQAMRSAFGTRNLPWMYWELASGFGLYDPVAKTWRSDMVGALYPGTP